MKQWTRRRHQNTSSNQEKKTCTVFKDKLKQWGDELIDKNDD